MSKLTTRIAAAAAETTDAVVALVAAAWPRSMTSREIERLTLDGYPTGDSCDVYFLLSFDAPDWERALDALQSAGFVVRDASVGLGAFVTVRTRVRLRAFELSLAGARLDRVVAPFGAFATLIGPALACRSAAKAARNPRLDESMETRFSGAA